MCIDVNYFGIVYNLIKRNDIKFKIATDIKTEIKNNNHSEFKNFFISVPIDEINDLAS